MAKIKSHKTPDQIAKKHGVDVSSIRKQLKIGISVEQEHTKNKELASDIALQHLDEFPDYYTRLKKMEKSTKNIKEAHEESRFCPLCDKREKRSECSYGENAWDKVSVKDEEYSMARSELKTIDDAVQKLMMKIGKGEGNLEAWVQSKITKAADYIDTAADYVAGGEMEESRSPLVDKIIDEEKKKMKGKDPCWKGYEMVGTKKKGGREVPNCVPEEVEINEDDYRRQLAKERRDERKNERHWRSTTGIGVRKSGPKLSTVKKSETAGKSYADYQERSIYGHDKKTKRANILHGYTFKDSYDYSWKKELESNPSEFEFIDLITPEPLISEATTRLQAQTGNLISVILSWKGKTYSLTMFFPQVKMPSRKDVEDEIQKVYPGSRVLQFNVTTVRGDQPIIQVQNSKSKNYLLQNKTIGEDTDMKKRAEENEKARKEMMQTKAYKDMAAAARKKFDEETELDEDAGIVSGLVGLALGAKGAYHAAKKSKRMRDYPKNFVKGIADPRTYLPKKKKVQKEEVEISEAKKSEMPCNKPKAEAHGSGETGKSHVVKACEGGKEKLIRFGQLGVKGSPKKKGESKQYASRRHRFQTRHAKNIAKGKMSAAYWANKVKW
jgi:hypothetical protein